MVDFPLLNIAGNDVVAVSGTSAQSAAFGDKKLMVVSTTACWIKTGTNPTAVADTDANQYLPANVPVFIANTPGDKIAVIQESAAGHLVVTPVGR